SGTPANWGSWNYYPDGTPHIGVPGNQTTEGLELNKRLQPSRNYTYMPGSVLVANHSPTYGSSNNGNVLGIADLLNSNRNQSFQYDYLNRVTQGSQADGAFNLNFSYDPWGNMGLPGAFNSANQLIPSTVGSCTNATGTYCYDQSGNMIWDTLHAYAYDAESRMKSVDSSVTYTYDAEGNRVRKDVSGSDPTEYIYFGGVPIAEHDPTTGDWSDYIYANGKRVVKADNFDINLNISGTNCMTCGWQDSMFEIANPLSTSYTVQQGDKLVFRQFNGSGAAGGLIIYVDTLDYVGNYMTGITDQNGNGMMSDAVPTTWHGRVMDLSSYAGHLIERIGLYASGNTTAQNWYISFGDIAILSADGTLHPIYEREASATMNAVWGASGVTARNWQVQHGPWDPTFVNATTTYYHQDHLGSSRLMTNNFGFPVWQGTFAPFGREVNPQFTTDHYLFTGDEHDAESNLEHTEFRQLSTTQGRWLSPDPYLGSMDLSNPQSLNRYSYVLNNPMNAVDALGLCGSGQDGDPPCSTGGPCEAEFGICGGGETDPGSLPLCMTNPIGCFASGTGVYGYCFFGGLCNPNGPSGGGNSSSGVGSAPAPQPTPNVNPSGNPPLSGETVGIPNTVHVRIPSILQTLGLAPNDPACDFIACGSGSDGFQGGVIAGSIACHFLEPCGAAEDALILGTLAVEGGLITYNHFAKGGTQNVVP
ncbi:MAG: hypothetical protein JO065_04920, partial [Acidobacteria bacterium]|nr:hypothetical protein [Acidobacteriota bacterium]